MTTKNGIAAAVGTFDGVHRGHRHLLERLKSEAAARGLQPLALTFDRHPLSLIDPDRSPAMLSSAAEREHLLRAAGVEADTLPFDRQLRQMSAREFLTMLRERYGVSLFLLGFNNRIGADRLGADSPELAAVSRETGVEVLAASEHPEPGVSSSAIRRALADGDMEKAARMLGHAYDIEGTVVHGRELGRTIGFPTANIAPDAGRAIPAEGVYVGRLLGHTAVVNVGRRPTVEGSNDAALSIEAHAIGFSGDLYGRRLRLELLHRLRAERKFASLDELKNAIAADVKAAADYDKPRNI